MGAGSILHFIILSSKLNNHSWLWFGRASSVPTELTSSRATTLLFTATRCHLYSGGSSQECGCLSAFALSFVGTLTSYVPTQPGAPAPPGRTQGCVHISILV